MAFVPVPKDLNRVKTKVMFNLTKRQLICFALAAAVGVPIFFLTKPSLGIVHLGNADGGYHAPVHLLSLCTRRTGNRQKKSSVM